MGNDNKNSCINRIHNFEEIPNNFSKLLKKYDKILIPKIQRDYAQGRDEPHPKEVRKNFLDAIFNNNNEQLDLDFIYGYVQKKYVDTNIQNCFIPLDGQQRLTTLFLLHWYFNKEFKCLNKFTYETRQSSKDFCKLLIEKRESIFKLINNNNKPHELSKVIKDSGWFFGIWIQDPTINSMLNMLDDIHTKGKNINIKDKLDKITFKFLNMGEHNLAEDLYVKMNSRGKPLTHFENFKVSIEKHLETEIDNDKVFFDDWKNKIDNKWTQFFWNYKENFLVDAPFMRFINRVIAGYYISKSDKKINELNENEQIKDLLESKSNSYIPQDVYIEILNNKNDFENLKNLLDLTIETKNLFEEIEIFGGKINLIKKVVSNKCSYEEQAYFYAISTFLLKNSEKMKYEHWFRFIRNIIKGENINNKEQYIRFVKFVFKQLKQLNSNDIYEYLEKLELESEQSSDSFKNQIKEETLKAKLILSQEKTADNKTWEDLIIEAENHSLFKGRIAFLLKKFDEKGGLINIDNSDIELFSKRLEIANQLWGENGSKIKKNQYLIIRAILSKCNEIPLGWQERVHLSNGNNWKSLFERKDIQKGLTKLFNGKNEVESIKDYLENNIRQYNNQKKGWMYNIIKFGNILLKHSKTKKVQKYYNQEIYLYEKTNACEGDILISDISIKRNEIIDKLLASNFIIDGDWRRVEIDDNPNFYKGHNIILNFEDNEDKKKRIFLTDSRIVIQKFDIQTQSFRNIENADKELENFAIEELTNFISID